MNQFMQVVCLLALSLTTVTFSACFINPDPNNRSSIICSRNDIRPASPLVWQMLEPSVIRNTDTNRPVRFTVCSFAETAPVLILNNQPGQPLESAGDGLWQTNINSNDLLLGYTPEMVNRNNFGVLKVRDASGDTRYNLAMLVADQNIPEVEINSPKVVSVRTVPRGLTTQGVRVAPHVVNIPGSTHKLESYECDAAIILNAISPRRYDFINLVSGILNSNQNRNHSVLRNDVQGLGRPVGFAPSRCSAELTFSKGLTRFPLASLFDLASKGAIHELGHQWINYSTLDTWRGLAGHWPLSTLAIGVMGYDDEVLRQGLAFGFDVLPLENDNYQLKNQTPALLFNDFELYMIGLLPASETRSHVIFREQTPPANGVIYHGPNRTVTINDWIRDHGKRIPDVSTSPKSFTMATIIMSPYPLSDLEMAYFDHFAARGESQSLERQHEGLSLEPTAPFFHATGARASLDTTIAR
jgi:hypothetical protein